MIKNHLTTKDPASQVRAPVVERVAGWSARHRIVVVVSWLLLVVAAFMVGQKLGVRPTPTPTTPARRDRRGRRGGYSRTQL
jgi:hypothetical protein